MTTRPLTAIRPRGFVCPHFPQNERSVRGPGMQDREARQEEEGGLRGSTASRSCGKKTSVGVRCLESLEDPASGDYARETFWGEEDFERGSRKGSQKDKWRRLQENGGDRENEGFQLWFRHGFDCKGVLKCSSKRAAQYFRARDRPGNGLIFRLGLRMIEFLRSAM